MKRTAFFLTALLFLASRAAAATESPNDRGYRLCNLHHLDACQNINQLFFGPDIRSGKPAFPRAVTAFLHGSPRTYSGNRAFTPDQIASESLVGPGDHHDHLPGGDWFFDGFTPHYAPDRGAVILSKSGAVLAVALVNTNTDETAAPSATQQASYRLRIYSRRTEAGPDLVRLLQGWAREVVGNKSAYPGVFPPNRLIGTDIVTEQKSGWTRRTLP